MTTRRDFLGAMAAGSALALASPTKQPWFDRPMRWAQLTLVEDDPGQYDLGFWLDYFRRTHSDAACLRICNEINRTVNGGAGAGCSSTRRETCRV